MRVSTTSGSLRVTITIGFLRCRHRWLQPCWRRGGAPNGLRRIVRRAAVLTEPARDDKASSWLGPRSVSAVLGRSRAGNRCAERPNRADRQARASSRAVRRILSRLRWRRAGARRCLRRLRRRAHDAQAARRSRPSGLPVPRFVSLKSDRVNCARARAPTIRSPGCSRRAGLPVEVIKEFDSWRQVRDSEGADGWVFHSAAQRAPHRTDAPVVARDRPSVPLYSRRASTQLARRGHARGRRARQHDESATGEWCQLSVDDYSRLYRADQALGRLRGRR